MQEKLLNFFNSIGFTDEDGDFVDASISKVVLKKKEEIFEIFIENERPINPVRTFELIKCASKGINGKNKCHINFIYNDMDDDDCMMSAG